MGKRLAGRSQAGRSQAGASALNEYRRARRRARRRALGSSLLALVAVVSGGIGVADGRPALTAVALSAALVAGLLLPEPDPSRWQRGAEGEVATAHLLAALPRRFFVMHDRRAPGARANIDHLVIGPTGVWVIDSKSFRAHLRVRRGRVLAGSHDVDTGPVGAQAARVQARFGCPVIAIVAVHGVGLRRRGKTVDGVRVLPAPRVCRAIRNAPRQLSGTDVAALIAVLDGALVPAAGTYR